MNAAVIKAASQISELKRENRELKDFVKTLLQVANSQNEMFISQNVFLRAIIAHNVELAQANLQLADELRARGVAEAISEESDAD